MVKIRSISSEGQTPEEIFLAMKNKTPYDWHMFYVFKDPEFAKANKALLSAHGIDIRATGIWDDGMIPAGKEVEFREKRRQLIESYRISLDDWKYFNKLPLTYHRFRNIASLGYDQEKGVVRIEVRPSITYEEVEMLYRAVKKFAYLYQVDEPTTSRKEPKDPALIYAIFKAKQHGVTRFKDIFSNYDKGDLKYYKSSERNYDTDKELADYYRKHDPEKYHFGDV